MQNSMVMFTFFFFDWEYVSFLGKFGPKSQIYQFTLKFGTYTNSNMQNSMMLITFFVFERRYSF